ncbi:MAG: tripartite tricarboxylate transporter substrate binding protein [Bradyrhizobium sp.]|nr:tripartite tricarboxylate transporter substrate binding protein [Bradyrhizobium sp.]
MQIFKALGIWLKATPLVLGSFISSPVLAADPPYPTRPIKIVVPFAAGGAVDVAARVLGKYVGDKLGQQFVVENKPGAGGLIAARFTVAAPPDGYTLLLSAAGEIAINPVLNKDAGYDADRDLIPVNIICRAPNVLVVNNEFPANTVAELISYARAHPNELTYSSSGIGTIQHITGEVFNQMAKIEVRHIPYSGAVPAVVDVASKRVTMVFASPGSIRPFVQKGTLKMLGVVMSERYSVFPALPTIKETKGMEKYDIESWFALFAPAGTPTPIIHKLNTEFRHAMQVPEINTTLLETAGKPSMEEPDEARAFVRAEIKKYADVVRRTKITKD